MRNGTVKKARVEMYRQRKRERRAMRSKKVSEKPEKN